MTTSFDLWSKIDPKLIYYHDCCSTVVKLKVIARTVGYVGLGESLKESGPDRRLACAHINAIIIIM